LRGHPRDEVAICEDVLNVSVDVCGTEVLKVRPEEDQLQVVLGVPAGDVEVGGARSPPGRLQLRRTTPVKPFDGVTVIV